MNTLLIGPANALVQNTVYALPARQVNLMSSAVIQTSLDNLTFADVAASTTGTAVTALFVKCTTGAAICVVKV